MVFPRAAWLPILTALSLEASATTPWRLVREDPARHITVETRSPQVGNYDEFRAVMTVPQPPSTVVAVLSDINAWPEWLARIRKVSVLRRDRNLSWTYVVYKLPYPFKERDTVLQSALSIEPDGHIRIRSLAVKGAPMPPGEPPRVHLEDLESTWVLSPLPDGGTRIDLSGRGEPGGLMPSILFNYNLPDEPLHTLRWLRVMLERGKYRVSPDHPDGVRAGKARPSR